MKKIPSKVTPDTIVEAILEIRFSTEYPSEAIFGMLYKAFQQEYNNFEKLPVMELPAQVREQNPQLKYSPNYKAQNGNYILQIGSQSFTISVVKEYPGWDEFYNKIKETYNKIDECKIIKEVERVGLRYVNVVRDVNIFEQSNLNASLNNQLLVLNTAITTDVNKDRGICTLRANATAEITLGGPEGEKLRGSVIDIDSVPDFKKFNNIFEAIEHAHDTEKELFFSILKEDFIGTLKPEYENGN